MTPLTTIYLGWSVWAGLWIATAWWSAPGARRLERRNDVLHKLLTYGGMALMLIILPPCGALLSPGWQLGNAISWAMVALMATGFAFACWARLTLGSLWSVQVERKARHHLVDHGPYAIVRHPIYTGLIAGGLATTLVKATPLAIGGLVLMVAGLTIKASLEERFLAQQLGGNIYAGYRQRVPMLLPFADVPNRKSRL